ncbi:MAG: thiamine-phosphate kinase [Bacteroidota bacterium]
MFEDKAPSRIPVEQLGEFALIKHLTKDFELHHSSSIKGIGDDAAVLRFGTEEVVMSTDLLIEGVHFDLSYMPLKHLGYKAVMVNLSDIYAMNAMATQLTVSLAVSNRFPLEALEELYAGVAMACKTYGVDLVGGDTTSSTKGMLLSITALGTVSQAELVLRSGAKANDLVVVTGDLGGAYMGLQVLEREKEVFKVNPNNQPDLEPYAYAVERQLRPEARKDIVALLKELHVLPTAMIDISDGLSSELLHLCEQSNLGSVLYENKIPIDPTIIRAAEEFKLDASLIALNGGEDYELLFTIAQEDYLKIKGNPNLTVIGHMTEAQEGAHLIARNNTKIPLQAQGWTAFSKD